MKAPHRPGGRHRMSGALGCIIVVIILLGSAAVLALLSWWLS
jgi:hypothetical protein